MFERNRMAVNVGRKSLAILEKISEV